MSSQSQKQRMLKLSMYARRADGISEDDFNKYWTDKHRVIVSDWLVKHGIVKYTQYHTPRSLIESEIQESPGFLQSLNKPLQYDGIVELIAPSIKCFDNARADPYYKDHVAGDEKQFLKWEESTWILGWEEVYIKDGVVVNMPEGDVKPAKVADDHHVHHAGGDEGLGAEMLGERH